MFGCLFSKKTAGSPAPIARIHEGKGGKSAPSTQLQEDKGGKGARRVHPAQGKGAKADSRRVFQGKEDRDRAIQELKSMGFEDGLVKATVAQVFTFEGALEMLMISGASSNSKKAGRSPVPARSAYYGRGQWQWGSGAGAEGGGKWSDYDAEANEMFTEAYLEGHTQVILLHGTYGKQGGYVADLMSMMQKRHDGSGNSRPIRGKVDGAIVVPLGSISVSVQPSPEIAPVEPSEHADLVLPTEDEDSSAECGYEWRDHKGWHKYDDNVNSAISNAIREKKEMAQVTINGRLYDIDLVNMQQKNRTTGAARDVRASRKSEEDAIETTTLAAIWEWCDDPENDVWIMYDEKAMKNLEAALKAGKSSITISAVNGLTYSVVLSDRKDMVQVSSRGNSKRSVRRTELESKATSGARRASVSDVVFENWQQHVGGGRWIPFGRAQAAKLEEAFLNCDEGTEIEAEDGGRLLVDFEKLVVEVKGGKGCSELRRLPSKSPEGFDNPGNDQSRRFEEMQKSRTLFEDTEFAGEAALFADAAKAGPVQCWLRPKDIKGLGSASTVILDDVLPRDVRQGSIGNCWIVSVLAVLATQPRLIKTLFVKSWDTTCGAAVIRLCLAGRWHELLLDDLFPCRRDKSLIYMSNNRQQLWAPFIEKAYAKLLGSYEALIAGQMYEAMGTLTGYACDEVALHEKPIDAAWMYVTSYLDKGFLLCTSVRSKADPEAAKALGLVTRHAYSVLDYYSGDVRLVSLRNPHGHGVWKGDWSDLSPRWNEPEAPAHLAHDGVRQKPPTGKFWISFEDFMSWFGTVQYCKVRPESWGDVRMDVSLAPPDLLGDRVNILRFSIDKATNTEISMLQVGKRGRGCLPGNIDIGFAVLRLCTSEGQESASIDGDRFQMLTDCARNAHGCVSLELEFQPGEYIIVPQVLAGRRAARPGTNQDRATVVIHSEHHVKVPRMVGSLPVAVLRDVLILRALASPEPYSSIGDGCDVWVVREPGGHSVVAVNKSKRFGLRVSVFADKSLRIDASRGSLRTLDIVPPGHAQVLQVLTFGIHSPGPKSIKWSLKARAVQLTKPEDTIHEPAIQQALHVAIPWPGHSSSKVHK